VIHGNVQRRSPRTAVPRSGGAAAIARVVLTRGTLTTRLFVAGTLLLVGLPVLTILVYIWGYPSTPVPLFVVVLVDGLQVLIVLNGIVVVAQLAMETGIRVPRPAGHRSQSAPLRRSGPVGLRELCLSLVEAIWKLERNGRAVPDQAVLNYIRDAVTAELEHRRRAAALERRLAELEIGLTGGAGAGRREDDQP